MKRLTPKTLVVLAIVAAASVAGFFSSFRGENQPIIDVPLHCLDLGTVLVQNDMRCKIPFRNPGGKPVPVSRLRASCRCVGLTPASFVIPPRATINVSTRLDLGPALLRSDGPEWTPTEWPFSVSIAADVLSTGRMAWELKGNVQSPVIFSATDLTFPHGSIISLGGSKASVASSARDMTVRIRCVEPVTEMEATCTANAAKATLRRLSANTSTEFILEVGPDDLVRPGLHKFNVVVSAVTEDARRAAVQIPVTMHVVDDIDILPMVVTFCASPRVGEEVSVRSRLDQPFVIEHIAHGDALRVKIEGDNTSSTNHRLLIALEGEQQGFREHRVRMRVFYPARHLSSSCEFAVLRTDARARGRHTGR